jgi:hypothetical protein
VAAFVIFLLIGFIIGSSFMSLYGIVSDAILLVFAVDEEINRVHVGKSSEYAPSPLKKFIRENRF